MDEKTKAQIQQEAADLVAKLQPRSGKFRTISPEMDPLRLGSGWSIEDLDKPQVIIESTFGDSHPGSAGLFDLVEEVRAGVAEAGGHGARYFCTDICDGEAQGHDGINYSLPSRDMIANMIEIHAKATPFDAGVFVASCDKGLACEPHGHGPHQHPLDRRHRRRHGCRSRPADPGAARRHLGPL